jgi:hypothetical protein
MNEPVKPLPVGEPLHASTPPADPQPDQLSLDDRVDDWLGAHPEGNDFDPNASAPPATEPQPTAQPPGEPPAPAQPQADAKPGEPPAPSAPPKAEPQAKEPAPPQPPADVKPPAAPEPTRFSLDAKYVFAEGAPPWTGAQIVEALRERQELLPQSQELQLFRDTFKLSGREAQDLWTPNLEWLRANPQQLDMMASLMADPEKASYILRCSQYWESPEVRAQRAPAQQPQLQMSPEIQKRFDALESQNKKLLDAENARKKAFYMDRIARDLNVAFERYPYLRENPGMVQALLQRAHWVNGGDDSDNAKGVIDALDMEKTLYDAYLIVHNQAKANGEPPPPPTPPPLMGSAGASPQTTPVRAAAPKSFTNLDDAVDEWMTNPPTQFR